MSKIRVHLKISGRVQGVWFRASARDQARSLGLTGWVRNLSDGRVEAVAEGEEKTVESFVAWCRKGPHGARVEGVDVTRGEATGEFRNFSITEGPWP